MGLLAIQQDSDASGFGRLNDLRGARSFYATSPLMAAGLSLALPAAS